MSKYESGDPENRAQRRSKSCLPRLIHILTPKQLSPLQHNHRPPSRLINRVNEPARLNTEPCALSARRCPLHLRCVDVFARVELEGWLGAVDFEMQLGGWVVELGEAFEGLSARVEGDLGGIAFHHEDVVDVWF